MENKPQDLFCIQKQAERLMLQTNANSGRPIMSEHFTSFNDIVKIEQQKNMQQLARITKVQQISIVAAEQLPEVQKKFVTAAFAPKIEERPAIDVQSELITLIVSAFTISGQKADDATIAVNAVELHARIMEVYPKATVDEVRTAIRAGVYEEYGEYFGLNVKSFMFFIRSYFTSQARAAAIKEWQSKRIELDKEEPDPDIVRRNSAHYTNKLYWSYCSRKLDFDLIPAFVYDFVIREGLELPQLDHTRAAAYYHTTIDKNKTRFVSNVIHDGYGKDREAGILHVAKQFAVHDYFKLCRSRKQPLIFFKAVFIP